MKLLLLPALLLALNFPARAAEVGVPLRLSIDPAIVKQGDQRRTALKTVVTLKAPAPNYFICEVRSTDKRKLACTNIIFKKGDLEGIGAATVYWGNVDVDTPVKVTALNVEAPDAAVVCTVTLQVKAEH